MFRYLVILLMICPWAMGNEFSFQNSEFKREPASKSEPKKVDKDKKADQNEPSSEAEKPGKNKNEKPDEDQPKAKKEK